MVARHKPSIGGRLACALEPFGRSKLAYNDRSGLKANPRNRVQKRASVLQLRILLDMFFDFFFQVFDLALDLFKEAAVCTANRLILGLIQSVLGPGFLFLEGLAGPRKLLKPALRR